MFAGGDYLLRRLLSTSPINQVPPPSWGDPSSLLPTTAGLFSPSITSNGIFGSNQSNPDSLLQDYNAALQLVQLQMLLSQQQPNLELLVTAMALQQKQLPIMSPGMEKHNFDGDHSQETPTIFAKQKVVSKSSKISLLSRPNSSCCSSPNNSTKTPPIRPTKKEENCERKNVRKRKLENEENSYLSASSKKQAKTSKKKFLRLDTETNSPVSGMFIKNACDVSADDRQKALELDDTAAYVHVSEDSRAAIASISNVIGESVCFLCKAKYEDVFRLAMHRCPRIMHEEYRCPECEKTFSCPANLASHRRWHKPKESMELADLEKAPKKKNSCTKCSCQFETKTALRTHRKECVAVDILKIEEPSSSSPLHFLDAQELLLDSLKMSSTVLPSMSVDLAANALISLGVSANKTMPVKVLI